MVSPSTTVVASSSEPRPAFALGPDIPFSEERSVWGTTPDPAAPSCRHRQLRDRSAALPWLASRTGVALHADEGQWFPGAKQEFAESPHWPSAPRAGEARDSRT